MGIDINDIIALQQFIYDYIDPLDLAEEDVEFWEAVADAVADREEDC